MACVLATSAVRGTFRGRAGVAMLGQGPTFDYCAHLDDWAAGLRVGNSGNDATTTPHLHFGVERVRLTLRRCSGSA